MCEPDEAIFPGGMIYSPDENFFIAGQNQLDFSKFHFIDQIASKDYIKDKVVHRIRSCTTAKNGLGQYFGKVLSSVKADLEITDWAALLAITCCHGRFKGNAVETVPVFISGDKNLSIVAEKEFGLSVHRLTGKTQAWHFISRGEGIDAIKALHASRGLPFPLV